MNLLSPAISKLARLRLWQIENWITHPEAVQRHVLQYLVTNAQYTGFGKKYNFSGLFTLREFKRNVPIHEYEDIKPYIQSMMEGRENVLWNTPVNWFAQSSGTTSDKSKFIPISDESMQDNHYKASKDVLSNYYKNFPASNLLTGKSLVVGGSHQLSKINDDIQYGDLSAVLMQNTPFWGHWLRTPELSVALLDEWENKIEQIAQITAHENVTSVAGVPTWTLLLMKRILEITNKKTIGEVWPNLELYMHGGVSFVPYKEQFDKIIGRKINYLEIYNASEGFIAAQQHPDDEGLLLFTDHGIFYEFMPVEEYGKKEPITVGLRDIKIGKNYALVISTTGGLWRYLIGDTIKFTSINPYKIKVSGRIRHYMNAFGEEVIIDNADQAIRIAAHKTGAIVNDYTAAPVYFGDHTNGAHEWLIEFDQPPAVPTQFTLALDEALQHINSDYEAKRYKSIALRLPLVHSLPKGTFTKWLGSKGRLGGQHKVPRLSNERTMLEDILALTKTTETGL